MRSARLLLLGSAAALVACRPSVGHDCSDADMAAARTIVYDSTGAPAYGGQAILIRSCAGGGSFCHTENATHRYGAPYDLNFDTLLADDPRFADEATGAAHLFGAQVRVHHDRDDIYATAYDRSMPPGQAGQDTTGPEYMQYAPGASTGTPLPGLDTTEGLEMLRVWLACGSPVVEATTPITTAACSSNADCAPVNECDFGTGHCVPVGEVVARRAGTGSAHWSSIYSSILEPQCATPACHGSAGAAFSGDLDLSSAAIAYAALVGTAAQLPSCGTRVVAGNPDGSLLVAKLAGTQDPANCGTEMPPGTSLPSDQIGLIRTWIMNGAPND